MDLLWQLFLEKKKNVRYMDAVNSGTIQYELNI